MLTKLVEELNQHRQQLEAAVAGRTNALENPATEPAARRMDGTSLAGALRAAIIEGEYVPNQRLVEADLCEQYGASRAAVRSALFELAGEGLVERLQNRGSRVRAISIDEAIEISEVRGAVEALCAAKAAERITDDEIAEFQELRGELVRAVQEGQLMEYSQLNQQLDRRILEISGQHTAVEVLKRLRAQGVRHQFKLALQPGRAQTSVTEHTAIIDAVAARRPEEAEKAVREHMRSVVAALREASAAGR
jgi:DNA-binding GntR family transcriptional regulator